MRYQIACLGEFIGTRQAVLALVVEQHQLGRILSQRVLRQVADQQRQFLAQALGFGMLGELFGLRGKSTQNGASGKAATSARMSGLVTSCSVMPASLFLIFCVAAASTR